MYQILLFLPSFLAPNVRSIIFSLEFLCNNVNIKSIVCVPHETFSMGAETKHVLDDMRIPAEIEVPPPIPQQNIHFCVNIGDVDDGLHH